MEKIKEMPIIGYIFRLCLAILKLPKHMDTIYQAIEAETSKRLKLEKEIEINLRHRTDELSGLIHLQEAKLEEINKQIAQLSDYILNYGSAIQELRWKNKERADEIEELQRISGELSHLYVDDEYIQRLNLLCSTHPTIWGDSEKISVSELAALPGCFFNTNSGRITVGDYTFSGSNVSLLAGSHDMNLTGLLRRDVELSEKCDITIGNGVWLASNCTILGPATIGDNAVIAAGAVVTPGTIVPAGAIYGGIPARQIGTISDGENENIDGDSVKNALERNGGMLFVSGWTEKKDLFVDEKKYSGHYLVDCRAILYLTGVKCKLFYHLEKKHVCQIAFSVDAGENQVYSLTGQNGVIDIDIPSGEMIHKIVATIEEKENNLFLARIC